MPTNLSRRELLRHASMASGLAALGGVFTDREARASRSPNEKLNIACIGCGGQGGSDLGNVKGESIVALCDVDEARAADSFKAYPSVPKYADFRKMLEQKDIEAVTVSIPDHLHATAASMAIKMGKHVYCQKPLTHNVFEARYLTELAAKHKVATQMGTQGHSFPQHARLVELIQSGAIGHVTEVHVITDRAANWWPQGMTEPPSGSPPVPSTLNWDLWLGPTAERVYNPAYLPFIWRGWWDFGTGALGDMACHLMDPVYWSLKLKFPTAIEAQSDPVSRFSPPKSATITWEFPKRGDLPPVKLVWYDGGRKIPTDILEGAKCPDNGSVFIGDKGKLIVEHGNDAVLWPEARFKGYKAPDPTLPRSPGHHREWINAAKTGTPTGSNFAFAGPMTESILLGNVALRVGKKIKYDARHMSCPGCPEADQYIRYEYRNGWAL